ncbi:hypothetical protein A5678_09910 [Mycobacterium sp. E2733]|nr:hypothetical protein A5678_09910 [Mycobacterium sp. E2733]
MGVDLLREHLGTFAVQSSRKRLTRRVTPHPCIVAHARSVRKEHRNQTAGTKPSGKPTTERTRRQPTLTFTEEVFVFVPEGHRR